MDPGINLHDERRDTFGNTHIRRFIAAGMTAVESGFQRPTGLKPDDALSANTVITTIFNVPNGEWEKIPRLQAKTLVGLRNYGEISQDLACCI
jgi:hypothetical protein